MSNYRRLISYIYAYEGGVKGKNIGYAKIEIRGGKCRIQVSVKNVYVGSTDIGVYLLTPGQEIRVGNIFVRNGVGEYRTQVDPDNIDGLGCSMDRCYGLTIHQVESAWQCYTTIWEDAVAQTAELQLADVISENEKKGQETDGNREDPQALELGDFPISEEIERDLEREQERIETMAPWEGDQVITDQTEEKAKEVKEEESDLETESLPELENPLKLQELDRLEQEETDRDKLWKKMQLNYAKIKAFDYDNGCEILSIKPQDIGLLPRETWMYGNNSFLLHGYYNYRYIILAKLYNPKGDSRYLLGVPGHYFSNEKHMAAMFGFPHFVLAKEQPLENGRFGYWYTDIRL